MARKDSVRTKAFEDLISQLTSVASHLESLAEQAKPKQTALDLMLDVGRIRVIVEGLSHEYRIGATDPSFTKKLLGLARFVGVNLAAGTIQLAPMIVTQPMLDSTAAQIEQAVNEFETVIEAIEHAPADDDDVFKAHGTTGAPVERDTKSTTGQVGLDLAPGGEAQPQQDELPHIESSSETSPPTVAQGSIGEFQTEGVAGKASVGETQSDEGSSFLGIGLNHLGDLVEEDQFGNQRPLDPSDRADATARPDTIRTTTSMPPVTARGKSVEGQEVTVDLGQAVEHESALPLDVRSDTAREPADVVGSGRADLGGLSATARGEVQPSSEEESVTLEVDDAYLGTTSDNVTLEVNEPPTPSPGQRWRNRETGEILLLISRLANINRWRVSMERGGDSQVDEADLLANYVLTS